MSKAAARTGLIGAPAAPTWKRSEEFADKTPSPTSAVRDIDSCPSPAPNRSSGLASAPGASMGTPNFWSSCDVEMYSCPPAWTPTVTLSMTRARLPRPWAMSAIRSGSSAASMTIFPYPSSMARDISRSDLLLPCSTRRRPGAPAALAISISPRVQVSMLRPLSNMIRTTSLLRKALPA